MKLKKRLPLVNLGVNTTNHEVQNQHKHCAAPYKESQEWMLQETQSLTQEYFLLGFLGLVQ